MISKTKTDLKYLISGLFCLLFVMSRYYMPDFFDNEWVYSINPIRILNPSFLSKDFVAVEINVFFLVYDTIVSPLYYIFDYLTATFICRVAIWIFQIWALSRLSKTLGITWWGFILLFVLWLNVEQTLVAGEWIIGSANAKPVSYGFVFLALSSFLQNRLIWSGIF